MELSARNNSAKEKHYGVWSPDETFHVVLHLVLTSMRLLWRCSSRANYTTAASLLSLIQAILRKNCISHGEHKKKKPTPFLDWVTQGNPAKKTKPILRLDCHRQPSKKRLRAIQFSSACTGTLATQATNYLPVYFTSMRHAEKRCRNKFKFIA